jgi:hypothetical protein
MINHVNHQHKKGSSGEDSHFAFCHADERTENYCGVSVSTVKLIRWESRDRNYAQLKPYIFDKVRMFPPIMSACTAKGKAFLLSKRQ